MPDPQDAGVDDFVYLCVFRGMPSGSVSGGRFFFRGRDSSVGGGAKTEERKAHPPCASLRARREACSLLYSAVPFDGRLGKEKRDGNELGEK